jgi:DNA-binding transcriptional MerR regulator
MKTPACSLRRNAPVRATADYPPEVLSRLGFIRRSQSARLTPAQIREILAIRDGGQAPCEHVQAPLSDRLD